ncbi:MAG: DNA-3-methyladenine glycosylase I [Arenicellales bacterium WSBS_2016_MAG_OTU3]
MSEKINRCKWSGDDPVYCDYHDKEWGVPLHDDQMLFEFLILEGAQAGLSWITILKKRDRYRQVFSNFDPVKVAKFNSKKVESLLCDTGIVRNRLKIESAISNANIYLAIQKEFGSFDSYIWAFVHGEPIQNRWKTLEEVPAKTDLSDVMAKDLKKRGFKFVGSTICYAFMQATGMVNDHTSDCFRHTQCKRLSVK